MSYRMICMGTACLFSITILLTGSLLFTDNIDVEKFMRVSVISMVFLTLTVAGMIAILIKQISKKKYAKNGMLADWYKKTLNLMGIDWLQKILEKTIPEKMTTGEKVTLASVSANKGEYEMELFSRLMERGVYPEFYLLDLCKVEQHVETVQAENGFLKYYEERNAFETISNFEELQIGPVDVLIDIKGCLWHSNKNGQEQNRAIGAFKEFYEVIKPGGILVTDAMDVSRIRAEINKRLGNIRNKKYYGYAEVSTMQRLEKQFAEYPEDHKWIQERFELRYVEIENRDPQIRMAIFTKK